MVLALFEAPLAHSESQAWHNTECLESPWRSSSGNRRGVNGTVVLEDAQSEQDCLQEIQGAVTVALNSEGPPATAQETWPIVFYTTT